MKLAYLAIGLRSGRVPLPRLPTSSQCRSRTLRATKRSRTTAPPATASTIPRTNSLFLDRKGWQAEVDKMIKVFGADIAPQDAAAIVDYLAKNYGAGS